MIASNSLSSLVLFLAVIKFISVESCTTIAVGKNATNDGSVFSSHSNDGEGDTDPRLVLIPASDWSDNASSTLTRPVFFSPESYPRYVGTDRASTPIDAYHPSNNDDKPSFVPICSIPQVPHTYSYMEGTYGALNSRQLGISESTCSGVFGASPRGFKSPDGTVGKACFSVDALTQIAMERHDRAREAIREIGDLAVEMGFYGAGQFEGTAESLMVTDKDEAWVFHVVPDPSGESAIWAAQRVPDDGFVVVANIFIIREIDFQDTDNFMYSDTVKTVAEGLGWWTASSNQPLDFTALYSDGEYDHKYYSGRRVWGVHHLFAPSLNLSPEYEEWRISTPYPFSATPDHKITLEDVANAMRYYYQGTKFSQAGPTSQSKIAGGPWNTPDHVSGGVAGTDDGATGNWERTIGLYRTSDSYITQSRAWLPDDIGGTLWWGAHAAPYTMYVPFLAGTDSLPESTLGHHMRLDKGTFFWANRYVANFVQWRWQVMMEEVTAFQAEAMRTSLDLRAKAEITYAESMATTASTGEMPHGVLAVYRANAAQILQRTWDLVDHLMFKYADGQVHNTDGPLGTSTVPRTFDTRGVTIDGPKVVDKPGYPKEWIDATGFINGPPPPPGCANLGWKCGHRAPVSSSARLIDGSKTNRLRGDATADADADAAARSVGNEAGVVGAWAEYLERKAKAIEKGTTGCDSRGDIRAGSSCKVETVTEAGAGDADVDWKQLQQSNVAV